MVTWIKSCGEHSSTIFITLYFMAHSVGVIGAGIAGLSCAEKLIQAGFSVKICEKSQGLSGRCSTRIFEEHSFDHGAQFFTAKSESFRNVLQRGLSKGWIAQWRPRVLDNQPKSSWYVGVPGMSSFGKVFSVQNFVKTNATVKTIVFQDKKWHVFGNFGELNFSDSFDQLILAIPSVQALDLIKTVPLASLKNLLEFEEVSKFLSNVIMLPCLTVMFSASKDFGINWPHDVYQTSESELHEHPIAWLAKNSSKPNRVQFSATEDWVIQASPSWSKKYLDDDNEAIVEQLFKELESITQVPVFRYLQHTIVHRWRYSRVASFQKLPNFWYSPQNQLGLCGDYFSTSRIESAFLSGIELSKQF